MQPSRRELLDDFLDFVGEQSDANARNTAERLLNRALHTLWLKHPWKQFVMPAPFSLTTVADQRSYALPAHFGRVLGGRIRNLTTPRDLVGIEPETLQSAFPDAGTTLEVASAPQLFMVSGTCGVGVLRATTDLVSAVSTSALDVTQRVTVEGYDSSGNWLRQSATLNGLTPVDFPIRVVPWTFGKSVVAGTNPSTELSSSVGSVLLSGLIYGATLQTLLPYESAVEHQVITLYPKPSAAGEVIAVPFLRGLVRSLYDGDPIPNNWQEAVFEEMTIQWRVNTGELTLDTLNVARPKFLDLLAFEQANRFGTRPSITPFTG